ncbi:MAG: hypothetical protein ACRDD0_11540, partial [Bacteroidales bacterium]
NDFYWKRLTDLETNYGLSLQCRFLNPFLVYKRRNVFLFRFTVGKINTEKVYNAKINQITDQMQ